jgi:hypothetical protein
VIEWHNDQTLFSIQWKQISFPLTKVEDKLSGVWSERVYQCHSKTKDFTKDQSQIFYLPGIVTAFEVNFIEILKCRWRNRPLFDTDRV